jgi:riboflavin biosynthesis pyrimidine reductase
MTVAESLKFAVLEEGDPSPAHSELEELYGRCLDFGSRLAMNFVETMDGATTFAEGDSGQVGMSSRADRLLMAMLRASASVIVLGASTFRASKTHQWTAGSLAPDFAAQLGELRRHICGTEGPAPLLLISSSGEVGGESVAIAHPEAPVSILTSPDGARRLGHLPNISVLVSDGENASADEIISTARSLGDGLILCEGGPHLFAGLLMANCVDDLFLTVAPQIAGETKHRLVEGVGFGPDSAPGAQLISARRNGDHLFLRYRFNR